VTSVVADRRHSPPTGGDQAGPRAVANPDSTARRRVRSIVIATVLIAVLAAVGLQVLLIGGQRSLEDIRSEIEVQRSEQISLRRKEAQLRSPAEIRDIATEELGMVPAAQPVLVTIDHKVLGYPAGDVRGAGTPTTTPADPADPAAVVPTPGSGG
jgi:hypothetical protein